MPWSKVRCHKWCPKRKKENEREKRKKRRVEKLRPPLQTSPPLPPMPALAWRKVRRPFRLCLFFHLPLYLSCISYILILHSGVTTPAADASPRVEAPSSDPEPKVAATPTSVTVVEASLLTPELTPAAAQVAATPVAVARSTCHWFRGKQRTVLRSSSLPLILFSLRLTSHRYIFFFTPSTIFSLRLTSQIFLSYAQSPPQKRCPD